MNRATKILILGITLGAVGAVLGLRLKQIMDERDPEALADRIAEDLRELEARTGHRAS